MSADTAHRVTVRFEEDNHLKVMQGVIDLMKEHRTKTNVNALVNFIIAKADMREVLRQMAKEQDEADGAKNMPRRRK